LTQKGRLRLVTQHLEYGRDLAGLAAENGISLRCSYRWLARYRSGDPASLADRQSVRRSHRRTLDPQPLQQAVDLRHQRLHLRHIARLLRAPFSTVARALNRRGLGRLRNLEPKTPVQRYECERPGDLIHVDVKTLARFRKMGHRITGDRQKGRSCGAGYDKVHVSVGDATRLAYVEVLTDEQKAVVIGFLSRVIPWFNSEGIECHRVMSDNCHAYVSNAFAKACRALGLKHIRTRPYRPRTNGKAVRYIQTPCEEWAVCRSRTRRNGSAGCLATCRSITGSGSTKLWVGIHLNSGSQSCSDDEIDENNSWLVLDSNE
jgi:transposase InsO family protein